MSLRNSSLERLKNETFDVIILGGGINGAVSAASLSAKGAKTALIDERDFAGFTSQNSSNLAWGGIKYMESYEFGLVRKLCMSRNKLMKNYPSTVQEIRFYTTISKNFRYNRYFLYMGTLFYWLMGNFFTKPPRPLSRETVMKEEPLIDLTDSTGGFEYSDCYLHDNDARFVFNFIRSAMNYGCAAANYVRSEGAKRENGIWTVQAEDRMTGKKFPIRGKVLINSCGPFADEHNQKTGIRTSHKHVFSKGIHLIVNQITPNKRILTFFADDGRLFFVIPMGAKTCIGTTDTQVDSPESSVTPEDRKFVLDNINKRLKFPKPLTEADVIAERCGVRPLVVETAKTDGKADWVKLSRKHAVDADRENLHISIFGGKLTDCLNVGDEISDLVKSFNIKLLYEDRKWYGEPSEDTKEEFLHQARLMDLDGMTDPRSSEKLSERLWRRYGANAFNMLEQIRIDRTNADRLIENAEYTKCELQYAAQHEMITKLEDFLRRRSKIELVVRQEDLKNAKGLQKACEIFFGPDAEKRLKEYFDSRKSV
ncbi:MAG TPA: glycerol-3-phosphate dehydrogenase/oxidase [Leptospiraceae bacterium]|nr:glycerol-3-phosphate dehydrogenase/oxidase [Leptospiraceae bacterium]HMY68079.1 glycerol-3-phosphate dehydrogenase/oxidase [Leptospiraceae bacterium]HNF25241.1 glycerol-3-phosphate dehydrogenase/oxidase [Leptospiraceae bacterium]HNM05996.1 glycerol-3-phosphate dehydrogenase/oxidase [Leptospiraceae bacterium]HNN02795.1 glycerol-3-phosphate dehydrogenase/oxidase [Leptospiraceae bacterium]